MPINVAIPNVGVVAFPDDMSHDDIASAIKNQIIPNAPHVEKSTAPASTREADISSNILDAAKSLFNFGGPRQKAQDLLSVLNKTPEQSTANPENIGSRISGYIGQGINAAKAAAKSIPAAGIFEAYEVSKKPEDREALNKYLTDLNQLSENQKAISKKYGEDAISKDIQDPNSPYNQAEGFLDKSKALGNLLAKNWTEVPEHAAAIVLKNAPQMIAQAGALFLGSKVSPATGIATSGYTSQMMEFGQEYLDLRAEGFNHDNAFTKASVKSGIVALFDAKSVASVSNAADKIFTNVTKGVTKEALKETIKETGKQALYGMAGEGLGSYATNQPVDPYSVLAEGIGEMAGAPLEALSTRQSIVQRNKIAEKNSALQNLVDQQKVEQQATQEAEKKRLQELSIKANGVPAYNREVNGIKVTVPAVVPQVLAPEEKVELEILQKKELQPDLVGTLGSTPAGTAKPVTEAINDTELDEEDIIPKSKAQINRDRQAEQRAKTEGAAPIIPPVVEAPKPIVSQPANNEAPKTSIVHDIGVGDTHTAYIHNAENQLIRASRTSGENPSFSLQTLTQSSDGKLNWVLKENLTPETKIANLSKDEAADFSKQDSESLKGPEVNTLVTAPIVPVVVDIPKSLAPKAPKAAEVSKPPEVPKPPEVSKPPEVPKLPETPEIPKPLGPVSINDITDLVINKKITGLSALTKQLTGKTQLEELTPAELTAVYNALMMDTHSLSLPSHMASVSQDLYGVPAAVEAAKTERNNTPITDQVNERGVGKTPEMSMDALTAAKTNIGKLNGQLVGGAKTGATTGSLMEAWSDYHRVLNDILASRRENPKLWADYAERQAQVAQLNVGDTALNAIPSPSNPFGQPVTILKKNTKTWSVQDVGGDTFNVLPVTLRPIAVAPAGGVPAVETPAIEELPELPKLQAIEPLEAPKKVISKAEEPVEEPKVIETTDGINADSVAAQVEKFKKGDFSKPSAASGTGREGIAIAKEANKQIQPIHKAAVAEFLSGELPNKIPPKKTNKLDVNGVLDITPQPIVRSIGVASKTLGDLKKTLESLIIPKDDKRFYLNGMHFDPIKNRISATDGNRLLVINDIQSYKPEGIPKTDVPAVINRDNTLDKESKYPDVDRVIPKQHGNVVNLNNKNLSDLANYARGVTKIGNFVSEKPSMPIKIGEETMQFNPKYISDMGDMFGKIGVYSTNISFTDAPGGKRLYVTSPDQKYQYVLMPLQSGATSLIKPFEVGKTQIAPEPKKIPSVSVEKALATNPHEFKIVKDKEVYKIVTPEGKTFAGKNYANEDDAKEDLKSYREMYNELSLSEQLKNQKIVIKEKPVKLEKNLKETYSVKASNVKETEKKAYDNVINNGSEESKQLIAKIDDYIKRLINRINELGYKHVDSNQYKAPEEIQNYRRLISSFAGLGSGYVTSVSQVIKKHKSSSEEKVKSFTNQINEHFILADKALSEKTKIEINKERQQEKKAEEPKLTKDIIEPKVENQVKEEEPVKEVHIEGKKEEQVTSEVIEKSIAKASEKADPQKIKKAVSNQFDQAIKRSTIKSEIEWKDLNESKGYTKDSFVTIDVPGDGKFKIKNNVERLTNIRDKLMKASTVRGASKPTINRSARDTETIIRDFIDDNEIDNAIEFAKLKGVDLKDIKLNPKQQKKVDEYLASPEKFEEEKTNAMLENVTKVVISDVEIAELQDHYGAKVKTAEYAKRLKEDVLNYINKGADSVAKAIREIIKKVAAGVLSVGIVFNQGYVNTHAVPVTPTMNKAGFVQVIANPTADFGKIRPSIDARFVADWVVSEKDNKGKPYMIVDKVNAVNYVFDENNNIVASAPVLLGAYKKGDVIPESAYNHTVDETTYEEKITPAGKFEGKVDKDTVYGTSFSFLRFPKYLIAMHKIYTGTPSENRQQRMNTETEKDNYISYGCINISPDFYIKNIESQFENGGLIYVMPMTQTLEQTFPQIANYSPTQDVVIGTINNPNSATDVSRNTQEVDVRKRQPIVAKEEETLTEMPKTKAEINAERQAAANGENILYSIHIEPIIKNANKNIHVNTDFFEEVASRIKLMHEASVLGKRKKSYVRKLIAGKLTLQDQQEATILEKYIAQAKMALELTKPDRKTKESFLKKARDELDDGNISYEVFNEIIRLANKIPQILEGVQLSVKKKDIEAGASFNTAERIVALYKGTQGVEDPEGVRHELTHSLEQMMDGKAYSDLIANWEQQVQRAMRIYAQDEKIMDYFKQVIKYIKKPSLQNSQDAFAKLPDGKLRMELYQYINPSEYWAVNAERLLKAHLGSGWDKFKSFVRRLFEGLKNILGFENKYPVHRVFKQIMTGEMERLNYSSLKLKHVKNGATDKTPLYMPNINNDEVDAVDELRGKYDVPEYTAPKTERTFKEAFINNISQATTLFTNVADNPIGYTNIALDSMDKKLTAFRNKWVYFAKGLELADLAKWKGKVIMDNGRAIATWAVTNAIHGSDLMMHVLERGKLKFDNKLQFFVAEEGDHSMFNIYKLEAKLAERIGRDKASGVIDTYTQALRAESILDEFNKRENELQLAIENGEDEETAQRGFDAVITAYEKIPSYFWASDEEGNPLMFSANDHTGKSIELHSINDEALKDFINQDEMFPELKEIMKNWTDINHNMIDNSVFSGVISKRRGEALKAIKNYVPWFRLQDDSEELHAPHPSVISLTNVSKEKKFLKGEISKQVDNAITNMEYNVMMMGRNAIRNYAAMQVVVQYATRKNNNKLAVFPKEGVGPNGEIRVNTLINGRRIIVEFKDPLIAESVIGMAKIDMPMIDIFAKISEIFRKGIVIDPFFQASQIFKDAPMAAAITDIKNPLRFQAQVVSSFAKNLYNSKSDVAEQFRKMGLYGVQTGGRNLYDVIRQQRGITQPGFFSKTGNILSAIGDSSDFAAKRTVIENVYKKYEDEAKRTGQPIDPHAMMYAIMQANSIMDYKRKGSGAIAQALVRTTAFLNVGAQLIDMLASGLAGGVFQGKDRSEARKQFAKTTAWYAGLVLVYCMLSGSDRDDQDEETKLNNWIIGRFKIPLSSPFSFLYKTIPELTYDLFMNQGTKNELDATRLKNALAHAAASSLILGPSNMIATGVRPFVEVSLNHDFFTGRTITPKRLEGLLPEYQYDENTSNLGKFLSMATGRIINPIDADHIVRGLTGTVGMLTMQLTNIITSDHPELTANQYPMVGRFFTAPVPRGAEEKFYELKELSDKTYKSLSNLRGEEAQKFIKENSGLIAAHQYVLKATNRLNEVNKNIHAVAAQKNLSIEEKSELILRYKQNKNNILQNVEAIRLQAGL